MRGPCTCNESMRPWTKPCSHSNYETAHDDDEAMFPIFLLTMGLVLQIRLLSVINAYFFFLNLFIESNVMMVLHK